MSKQIIFYTDNTLNEEIASKVRINLKKIGHQMGIPIVCVSLKKMDFGDKNIYFPNLERGILTLFRQQLAGVESSTADILFFCEHDVLYHPSHFDFIPPTDDAYYYNTNVWKVRLKDGHGLYTNNCQQTSGLCGYRPLLLEHYRKRIVIIEQRRQEILALGQPIKNDGYSKYMGYEPGRQSKPRGVDSHPAKAWQSEFPNVDIRHDSNFTRTKWKREDYHDHHYTEGWTEQDNIPGWGHLQHFWKRVGRMEDKK